MLLGRGIDLALPRQQLVLPPAWAMFEPALALGFTEGLGWRPDTGYAAVGGFLTTTRASDAYADDTAGNWSLFASGVPRITDKGLLVEEARTNSIRNNSMQGVVAGTPGTAPTNWFPSSTGGVLTRTIVGTGTENGIDYIDIRYQFSGSGTAHIQFESGTSIAASVAQSWAASAFVKLVGGALTNITSCNVTIIENDSGGVFLAGNGTSFTPDGTLTRRSHLRTLNQATVAFTYSAISIVASSAADITLRIGWPQLELGSFATFPIRTTSAAATRAADVITVTNPPTFGSAITAFVDAIVPTPTNTATKYLTGQALNNRLLYFSSVDTQVSIFNGTNILTVNATGGWSAGAKAASAIDGSGRAIVMNGGTVATDANAQTIPTSIGIGSMASTVGGPLTIRRVAYFPTRLTNAQLQELTA